MKEARKEQLKDVMGGCTRFLVDGVLYAVHVVFIMLALGILHRAGWTWLPDLSFVHTAIVIGAICIVMTTVRGWWTKGEYDD